MAETPKQFPIALLRLNIELIADALGFGKHSKKTQLYAIAQYHRDCGLSIKCDEPMRVLAQEASSDFFTNIHPDGTIHHFASDNTFEVSTTGETITLNSIYIVNSSLIGFESFTIGGTEMYAVDESSLELTHGQVGTDDVYIESEELERFIRSDFKEIPEYSNRASDNFAPLLTIAIELHYALRVQNYGNIRLSRASNVSNWLNKFYPDVKFSQSMRTQLSIIIGEGKKSCSPR